jgi:cobalamin biosynthesis Mg chelatase CobN
MARQTIAALAAACGLALILLPASVALADNAFDQVLKDYQSDGQIDQCAHSEKTLNDAQHQIQNDIQQYAPDFPAALTAALRQRAAGTCDKKASGGTTTTAAAGGTGGSSSSGSGSSTAAPSGGKSAPAPTAKPGAPPTPPPVAKPAGGTLAASIPASASASKAGTPLPIILLAILGGLLLVIGLVVWFARFMGWGLDRWQRTLQTWREAGYQSENAISEFADWVRHGR